MQFTIEGFDDLAQKWTTDLVGEPQNCVFGTLEEAEKTADDLFTEWEKSTEPAQMRIVDSEGLVRLTYTHDGC